MLRLYKVQPFNAPVYVIAFVGTALVFYLWKYDMASYQNLVLQFWVAVVSLGFAYIASIDATRPETTGYATLIDWGCMVIAPIIVISVWSTIWPELRSVEHIAGVAITCIIFWWGLALFCLKPTERFEKFELFP